jgi:hypothetical protein
MEKIGKTEWCPKCQKYPDRINEVYENYIEMRKWCDDIDCYEIDDSKDEGYTTYCGECDAKCEYKEVKR